MTIPNQVFTFVLTALVLLVGLDFLFRSAGPRPHAGYRRFVGRLWGAVVRHTTRFVRWAWREYAQFIVGVITGVLGILYFQGHFK